MKIAVFDLPASDSGALAILRDFYDYVLRESPLGIEWCFLVSTDAIQSAPCVNEGSRVEVLHFPDIKKGWLHRIAFEIFEAPRLLRHIKADIVFSLQNVMVLGTCLPQVVYVHQSLPYIEKRFSYLRREERFLAFYADIFRPLIGRSARRADGVIVQTSWFRDAIVRRHRVPPSKITVIPPSVRIVVPEYPEPFDRNSFFYPTTPHIYKNIELIIKAAAILKNKGITPKIVLTIRGDENTYSRKLREQIACLGLGEYIHLAGRLPRNELASFYLRSTLVFPSRLESFGLPLLEARSSGGMILAGDMPFSREILEGYNGARFFDVSDAEMLAGLMGAIMHAEQSIPTEPRLSASGVIESKAEWGRVLDMLSELALGSKKTS